MDEQPQLDGPVPLQASATGALFQHLQTMVADFRHAPHPQFPLLLACIDGAHLGYPFSPASRPRHSHILRYEKAQHDPATNGTTDVLLGNYTELWKVLHNCQGDLLLIVRAQDLTNGGYSVRAMDWMPEHGLDMIPLVDETDARLSHTPYFTFHRHHRVACL